jgi:hypothetical protein
MKKKERETSARCGPSSGPALPLRKGREREGREGVREGREGGVKMGERIFFFRSRSSS